MTNRGIRVWNCQQSLILGIVTAILVFLLLTYNRQGTSQPTYVPVPPPSPLPPSPPEAMSHCDWCGDLTTRLGELSAAKGSVIERETICVGLSSRDFVHGTYIIDVPNTCYFLEEDIVFHPSPETDFRATREPYSRDKTFVLDFPAAILVRAPSIQLDLNGHTLSQSREHYVQQRFYAHIELTTPFLDGQGPADFVDGAKPPPTASRFTLRNGKLGLSSHHGIHGNGGWSVLIEDVDISNYEVAAVALNGMNNVVINRVRALGTFDKVPLSATYSSARFMMPFVQRALSAANGKAEYNPQSERLRDASLHLKTLMDQVLADVSLTGFIDKSAHPEAYALFGNPSGLPDGGAGYGFLLHTPGVAVNGFECDPTAPRQDKMHHIVIMDSLVRNTRLHSLELPVLQEVATSKLQRGPVGDILRISELVGPQGEYVGNALSETKLALQALVSALGLSPQFGTLAIHPVVHAWASGDTNALAEAVKSGSFRYLRNGDNMFHVNKGVIGIRIGGGHHVAILRTIVDGVINTGNAANMDPLPGETAESAYWTGAHDGGHPAADPQHGYGGADSSGITIAATKNVILDATIVRNVHARLGWSSGIYAFNGASDIVINDGAIYNVTAHPDPSVKVPPPKMPRAVGVVVTTDAAKPTYFGKFDISEVQAGGIGMACHELLDNTRIDGCAAPDVNFYTM